MKAIRDFIAWSIFLLPVLAFNMWTWVLVYTDGSFIITFIGIMFWGVFVAHVSYLWKEKFCNWFNSKLK